MTLRDAKQVDRKKQQHLNERQAFSETVPLKECLLSLSPDREGGPAVKGRLLQLREPADLAVGREFCHSADTSSLVPIEAPAKGRGGAAE